MNVLLDECVPRKLKRSFEGHNVVTVREAGWAGVRNGELLRRAAGQFDVLLTVDKNLQFQQNLMKAGLGVLLLIVRRNSFKAIQPLVPEILQTLPFNKAG